MAAAGRLEYGTVLIVSTKADRRAARERVSAYHQSQLAELLSHVAAAINRYRAGEIDAYAADETIHHYHRAAENLWKFCFARGGGTHGRVNPNWIWPVFRDSNEPSAGPHP